MIVMDLSLIRMCKTLVIAITLAHNQTYKINVPVFVCVLFSIVFHIYLYHIHSLTIQFVLIFEHSLEVESLRMRAKAKYQVVALFTVRTS